MMKILTFLVVAFVAYHCADAAPARPLMELLEKNPDDFSTLITIMKAAYADKKKEGGEDKPMKPHTALWPTNKAFEKIKKEDLDNLMKDPAALRKLIKRHSIPGKLMFADFKDGPVTTSSKETLDVDVSDDKKSITIAFGKVKANIVKPDLAAGMSVAHGIDTVLM